MPMMIVYALLVMGAIALVVAGLLFAAAHFFFVQEDQRKTDIEAMLPGINCGACGFPGCPGMAEALVKAADTGDISHLNCPPGGTACMSSIASYLGLSAGKSVRTTAVLRCGGSHEASPAKCIYDGPRSCLVSHVLFAGLGACAYGCLGEGDCVRSCTFDAIHMDEKTGIPVIDAEKCTSCSACVSACPRSLIAILPYGRKGRRVWVNCNNTEKGALARKNCTQACIACGKCVKVCDTVVKAISITNNLAKINAEVCIACGKCVQECPTKAIVASFLIKQAVPDSIEKPVITRGSDS